MVQPILRFVRPDYRRVAGASVPLAVVAFSKHDIASVQFTISDSVNPDVVETATAYSLDTNDDDPLWVMGVEADLTSLNDGPVTVTALATDGSANTRSIVQTINNNSGDTLPDDAAWVDPVSGNDGTGAVNDRELPFETIMAAASALGNAGGRTRNPAGCTIYLEEGSHTYGTYSYGLRIEDQTSEWLRITKAADASRDATKIVGTASEGLRGYYIWFDDLKIEINQSSFTIGPRNTTSGTRYLRASYLEIEDVDYAGQVEAVGCFSSGWDFQWYQNCTVRNMRNGFAGELVRNVHYERLGEDLSPSGPCLLNVQVDEIDYGTYSGTWHPDGIQLFSVNENLVYFNVRGVGLTAQLIFQGDSLTAAKDVAVINALLVDSGSSGFVTQFLSGFDHLILWHVHADQTWRFDETEATLQDLDIRNSITSSLSAQGGDIPTLEAAGTIDYLLQEDDGGHGTNPINGSALAYEDSGSGDYRLSASSDGFEGGLSSVPWDQPTGSVGPRNASTPDVGPFPNVADPTALVVTGAGSGAAGGPAGTGGTRGFSWGLVSG